MSKFFKSIDEQIDLLKSQGLKVDDRNKAEDILLHYNYYKVINGGGSFFRNKEGSFNQGINLSDIFAVHNFDKELKKIVLSYMLEVERHFRSIVSYVFMINNKDINAYLSPGSYQGDDNQIKSLINKLENTVEDYSDEINYSKSIRYYKKKYGGVPFWFLVNFLSLGTTINFFKLMKIEDKKKVSQYLNVFIVENLSCNELIKIDVLESFLDNIREVRNISAHDNLILDYKCNRDSKYLSCLHDKYKIKKEEPRRDVFNVILSMQIFLHKSQFTNLMDEIKAKVLILSREIDEKYLKKVLASIGYKI